MSNRRCRFGAVVIALLGISFSIVGGLLGPASAESALVAATVPLPRTAPSGDPLLAITGPSLDHRLYLAGVADNRSTGQSPAMTDDPELPGLGVYQPVLPNDLSAVEQYERSAGKHLRYVHWFALWGGWKSAFSRSDLDQVAGHGSIPLITWEPWSGTPADPDWSLRSAILSGRSDAYIDSWARGLAAYGGPVLLRFAHEMHHSSYPWAVGVNGNTAEDYVAAWQHVRSIFERYNTSNVQWVWNPNTMGDTTAAAYDPIYRSVFPGDDLVDWVGLDIYNTGPSIDWGAPYWRSFEQVLDEPYAAITAISAKPVLIGEIGSTEAGGDKARWISEALSTGVLAGFPRVRAIVWFDVQKEAPWQLRSSTAAFQSFVSAWRQSFFP